MAEPDVEVRKREGVVLVPRDEHVLDRVLHPVEVEVVHPRVAEEAVVLRDEVLRRHIAHERR